MFEIRRAEKSYILETSAFGRNQRFPRGVAPNCCCYDCPILHAILLKLLKAALAVAALTFLQIRFADRLSRSGAISRVNDCLRRLAKRKTLAAMSVGLAVLAIRVALIPHAGIPQPRYPDEFSYLLAGDTFAHGRLTNPTHPMWVHFESLHIIQQPTYMSMDPPAEGMVLAVGERLGCPWIGQLLITSMLCAALCWALQGWLPSRWALLGGVLAAVQVGILSYWMNGYWSASVPAVGGALVIGSLPRIWNFLRSRDAALLALGLVILANSRPYEGLVLALPATLILFWKLQNRRFAISKVSKQVVLTMFLVLAPAALGTAYYNQRVTGSAGLMPYQVNTATYKLAPYFFFQRPFREPLYRNPKLRAFYREELREFEEKITPKGYLREITNRALSLWEFFVGAPMLLGLMFFPRTFCDRRVRIPIILLLIALAGLLIDSWYLPHYFAPAMTLIYVVSVQAMRHLSVWRHGGKSVGAAWVRSVAVVAVGLFFVSIAQSFIHPAEWQHAGDLRRAQIVSDLNHMPGQHLVIVKDQPPYGHGEWVYNGADIDSAKIVWARDMGKQNEELLNYFHGRAVWTVNLADSRPALERAGTGR